MTLRMLVILLSLLALNFLVALIGGWAGASYVIVFPLNPILAWNIPYQAMIFVLTIPLYLWLISPHYSLIAFSVLPVMLAYAAILAIAGQNSPSVAQYALIGTTLATTICGWMNHQEFDV